MRQDADVSIRRRALDLVLALVNEDNIQGLTTELLDYLKVSCAPFVVLHWLAVEAQPGNRCWVVRYVDAGWCDMRYHQLARQVMQGSLMQLHEQACRCTHQR